MHAGDQAVKRFVLRYLELLGAAVEETEPGLFRIELSREQAAELEGGNVPAWLWTAGPNPPSQVTYYFTFSPETAQKHAAAELVSPGSHRLQQVVESVRNLARATRAHLPAPPGMGARFRPFYLMCLRVDFRGSAPRGQLFRVAVDRVDGVPLRQLAELLSRLPLAAGPPPEHGAPVERPRLDLADAFLAAYRELLEQLERSDAAWAQEALESLIRERERLVAYFEQCQREGLDVSDERARRLAELEAVRPRVHVRLQGVCEAYLPVRTVDGTVEHLALLPLRPAQAPAPAWR